MIANKKQLIINTQRASNHFGCPLRMLIKPLIMSILLFLSIIYSSSIFAIEINISLSNTNEPIVGTRYIAIPVDYDSVDNHVIYTANNGLFNIKAESNKRNIIYSISNGSDSIIRLSFSQDSILKWQTNNTYDNHAIKFKYDNKKYFFIPGTKIQYNDTIYNRFPCMIAKGDIKQGYFNAEKSIIYILQDNSLNQSSIFVKENGQIHNYMSLNGLVYKPEYSITDTIPINQTPYIIHDLDWDKSTITLSPISNRAINKIDIAMLSNLFKGAEDKEYIFIDFWGTWCAPCIQILPKIKDLYLSNKEKIEFLSICYDSPENYTKHKKILDTYGIEWNSNFISFDTKSSIVDKLNIESFPSFALIDKCGKIIFILSGDNSLDTINSLFKDLSSSK